MMDYKPTRSELLAVKKKIVFAEKGHDLLKKKRDGLIMSFFEVLEDAKTARTDLQNFLIIAEEKLGIAVAVEGTFAIRSAAHARKDSPQVKIGRKNLMGVVVPVVSASNVIKRLDQRGYGVIGTSNRIDEAAKAYEELLEAIIKVAEKETIMKKLLDEIEGTRRRVNALEYKILPELNTIENIITMRLEELERENIFRLKRFKKLSAEHAEA
ncbi:MAG: V-type ATP synthase subunit D [Thermoplasmata archaeon]|nr:V-type ATP synthase subunit D [Thermoplasmata archaeon]MCK5397984.1 V-type ATP synthase subunit D [Thermoplasmata archaeon]